MKEFETIIYRREGPIAYVTINRPKAMNALNMQVIHELGQALQEIEADRNIRVVIFTGEGRAFVAGADIAQMVGFTQEESREMSIKGSDVMLRIDHMEKVTIAAVNGYALGGGCELALCCDLRVASEKAMFGQPEVALGIMPGFSGTQRLPRAVGPARAKEIILTGDPITAEEAYRIGLVNKVVPHESLMEEAEKMAQRVLKNAPISVRYANTAIQRGSEQNIETGIIIESSLFDMCFGTDDQKEGMAAFLEKRKAVFTDK
ncbi:MAG: enoyl-CoA hydratase/isomerase family protein [Firmicutes bacterium]|nr:enoyl-CoA hydratase/isomerase family protein [Bacillota bacterium]